MESSVAALIGAAIGSLTGLTGPMINSNLQSSREQQRWLLDNRKTAYVDAIQHLSTGLNMRSHFIVGFKSLTSVLAIEDVKAFFDELSRAQTSLASLLILCRRSERTTLSRILQDVTGAIEAMKFATPLSQPHPFATLDIAMLQQQLVESARSDLQAARLGF
jgi:hypothetical protein